MAEISSSITKELQAIGQYVKNCERLQRLFQSLPVATPEVYILTSEYYAAKKYDEYNASKQIIPHGFYGILENSIINIGLLPTLRKYEREINLIATVMNMEAKELKTLIMDTREKKQENLVEREKRLKAQATLKEIIRKFSAKYKEDYIKDIISKRKALLDEHTTKIEHKVSFSDFPIDDYIEFVKKIPLIRDSIEKIILDKTGVKVTEKELEDIIRASFSKNYKEHLKQFFGITVPSYYDSFTANRTRNRLKNNYEKKLNKQLEGLSLEEKEVICRIINYRTKVKRNHISEDEEEFKSLKSLVRKLDLVLAEEISTIMSKCEKCEVMLVDGYIVFNIPQILTKEEYRECIAHKKLLTGLNKIHDCIQTNYRGLNYLFANQKTGYVKEEHESYEIDLTYWFKSEKIIRLMGRLNLHNIFELDDEEFEMLRSLLIDKGLLWAYVCDNIDVSILAKIINSFKNIKSFCDIEILTKDNLYQIVKNANIYGYADEVLVGLVGLDNISKIIGYNQFCDGEVTDTTITDRLKKIVLLSVKSESYNKSSLPFNCSVRRGKYTLSRYFNNDPDIFTSGIDTKTCFFVSVNENDFFFYSLLNKDGYVVKIVNENNELVARASCFRKNNILMINGVRLKNNKVLPQNQEELKEMIEIVEMFRLMALKMIALTSNDECPIDYVVCNRAGILENSIFENKFESINPLLFREPINVYNDEWQEFVHLFDGEEMQPLQEIPTNPEHSFTTDFGDHYPALLLASRDFKALLSPYDISLNDESAIYKRPRKSPESYLSDEISSEVLDRLNRIRALSCFYGSAEEQIQKRKNYRLITSNKGIKDIIIGDDWCILTNLDDTVDVVYATQSQTALIETSKYLKPKCLDENGVRLYFGPQKKGF